MTGLLLLAALLTAGLDQATKRLTARPLANTRGSLLPLTLRQAGLAWVLALACVASVVTLASPLPALAAVGLGLVAGGVTGNLADRVTRGAVVDFILVGRWPAFNVADAAMTCGLAAAAWSLL
ncbi:MAG: signal peptidase II [Gaiellaceae bacterium]